MAMTYILEDKTGDFTNADWFFKSYHDFAMKVGVEKSVDEIDRLFEQEYNIKFRYGPERGGDNEFPIEAIEFENEAEATLFVLKWVK